MSVQPYTRQPGDEIEKIVIELLVEIHSLFPLTGDNIAIQLVS